MISPAVRLRSSPMAPVRQKAQPKPQPTWVDTQSVRRSPSGIRTDWTRAPSVRLAHELLAPVLGRRPSLDRRDVHETRPASAP